MARLSIQHVNASNNSKVSFKLFGRPGGAENVISWMERFPNGCFLDSKIQRGVDRDETREKRFPRALCFWYENGTFLAAIIRGSMCHTCYQVLVAEFVTMTATYTAGYIDKDGKWIDEDFDAEIFSAGVVNTIHPRREPRIRQSSYEEIAAFEALRKDGRPFYYDKACLINPYDPAKDAKEENDRIWAEIKVAYDGCAVNYGFDGGENCMAELKVVGNRHRQLSRDGIYFIDRSQQQDWKSLAA